MSARSLGTLTIDLIAQVGGFVAGMTEAERVADKRAKQIKKNLKEIGKDIDDLAKMGAVGFTALAGGMAYMTKQAVDAIDAQSVLASQFGVCFGYLMLISLCWY